MLTFCHVTFPRGCGAKRMRGCGAKRMRWVRDGFAVPNGARWPGYCCCRRPQGQCAHRCYLFPCARNTRGLCCVRVPRLGVRGAKQPHAVRRQEPPRAASSSTISEPVRAPARLAGPPANARRFCSVAPPPSCGLVALVAHAHARRHTALTAPGMASAVAALTCRRSGSGSLAAARLLWILAVRFLPPNLNSLGGLTVSRRDVSARNVQGAASSSIIIDRMPVRTVTRTLALEQHRAGWRWGRATAGTAHSAGVSPYQPEALGPGDAPSEAHEAPPLPLACSESSRSVFCRRRGGL